MMNSTSSRWKRLLIAAVVIVGAIGTLLLYDRLFRERQASYFESDEDHFLYGSVGTEATEGIPYWIWLVLPRIVPDLLPGPGGYASLGIISANGREMPVGFAKTTIGQPRVGTNCAFCHTASVRLRADDVPMIVPGAPAHQTNARQYQRFLFASAGDARFTAGNILGEIARNYRLSLVDRLLYRFVIIPETRRQLLRQSHQSAWTDDRPDWGHGRADVVSPVKLGRLGRSIDKAIGTSDAMPLWNMTRAAGRGFFWDGLQTSLRDAVVFSALSDGASRPWLDRDVAKWDDTDARTMSSLRRVQNYIGALKPPPYPFAVDAALATVGEVVYKSECAQCHAQGGSRTGQSVPSLEVGTDGRRLDVWTESATTAYDAFAARRAWKGAGFRTGDGYMSVSLDGVWLRAPYLHNGSVPSLRDLMEAPANRPARFWRGYDVYDPVKVGFVYEGPDAERMGTLHDTAQPGNGNTGHMYGTTLSAESKRALVEYLKTR